MSIAWKKIWNLFSFFIKSFWVIGYLSHPTYIAQSKHYFRTDINSCCQHIISNGKGPEKILVISTTNQTKPNSWLRTLVSKIYFELIVTVQWIYKCYSSDIRLWNVHVSENISFTKSLLFWNLCFIFFIQENYGVQTVFHTNSRSKLGSKTTLKPKKTSLTVPLKLRNAIYVSRSTRSVKYKKSWSAFVRWELRYNKLNRNRCIYIVVASLDFD